MATTESKSRKPTHDICFVKEPKTEGGKAYWDTIGAGWAHEDGKGITLNLDYIPLALDAGRIVVRLRQEKSKQEAAR